MRVLKWVVDRCQNRAGARQTALGWMPRFEDIDWSGFEGITKDQFDDLTQVDTNAWREELKLHNDWFEKLKSRLPKEFALRRDLLELGLVD